MSDATTTPTTQTRIDIAVMASNLAYIRQKIDQVCDQFVEQDKRLDQVERITWAISAVSGLLAAIFIPIAVAAIKVWLGL